jgi:hypothetical protein
MKAELEQFHEGSPSETKRNCQVGIRLELSAIFCILATHWLDISVANKLISTDVVFFDPGTPVLHRCRI